MPEFIYTMKGLGKVHPPDAKVLEDIWLSFYYGAKIGVLGLVDDPADALAVIGRLLRPGGTLSLLVNQRHAAVVTRAMAGHFQQARALLDDAHGAGGTTRRFTADEITAVLDEAGFDTRAMHAVRVFVDLVPSSLVDLEPGAAAALVELEQAVASRPEYLALGTQIHAVATLRDLRG